MSILSEIKKVIIGYEDDNGFDNELLAYIDFAIGDLVEIESCKKVEDPSSASMDDLYIDTEDDSYKYLVRQYILLSVRLSFDPPTISTLYQALDGKKRELMYRLTNYKTKEGGYQHGR